MKYERNYKVVPSPPKPVDPIVSFDNALEGVGYLCPVSGDLRVRSGSNGYIRFNADADCSINVDTSWPDTVRLSHAVDIELSLKIWRKSVS